MHVCSLKFLRLLACAHSGAESAVPAATMSYGVDNSDGMKVSPFFICSPRVLYHYEGPKKPLQF
jgi:hypothetical protein